MTGSVGSRPAAVLWDLDGTLVDTEPYWIEAEFALVAEHGRSWSQEHALNLVGNALIVSARYIKEHTGIPLEPEEIVERLVDDVTERVRREVPWRPGARELVEGLRHAGAALALVTMSYRRMVGPVLDALQPGTFGAVVTGDEVTRGKPDPEPYLRAAELLGVAPEACLAIEDSGTGAASAEAAGCLVLVVPSHVAVPEGERRVRRETLAGVTPADLGY